MKAFCKLIVIRLSCKTKQKVVFLKHCMCMYWFYKVLMTTSNRTVCRCFCLTEVLSLSRTSRRWYHTFYRRSFSSRFFPTCHSYVPAYTLYTASGAWNGIALHEKSISELRSIACHMGLRSVCYLPSDTGKRAWFNPSQRGCYPIYLPQIDGRLSWPWWVVIYQNGLPVCRQSPIQVVTTW